MGIYPTRSTIVPEPMTYLFADAGYLRKCYEPFASRWFSGFVPKIDFTALMRLVEAKKCFYYDCPPHRRDTESDSDYITKAEPFFSNIERIRSTQNTHVWLGATVGKRGKRARQKEVDVKLAVDAMSHAVRGNMGRAVILAGDRDFRPLVEALVNLGLFVWVAGERPSVADELRMTADHFIDLGFDHFLSIAIREDSRVNVPRPETDSTAPPPNSIVRSRGTVGERKVYAYNSQRGISIFVTAIPPEQQGVTHHGEDFDRLRLFLEMYYRSPVELPPLATGES